MNNLETNKTAPASGNKIGRKSTLLTLAVIVLILASALAAGAYIVKSTPKANRKKPVKEAPQVITRALRSSTEKISISATGTVIPVRELGLQAEVSGRVVNIHNNFELGSQIRYGDKLLMLEPADYQLAVVQAESKVANASYALAIEEGNQEISRQEWKLYDAKASATENDKELALRKPHLLKAQAEHKAAKAELTQAELNLQRTVLYAPFNALVTTKSVEPGGYLSSQNTVATLVGTDRYWVQVSLPVDRLSWIEVPQNPGEQGSLVQISAGAKQRQGRVAKLLGDLEGQGRMARLLVEVDDPLDLKRAADQRQPLLLGEYVHVEIDGRQLSNVISIPRSALHDGNQIWLVDGQHQLQLTTVDVIWRDSDQVLLSNSLRENSQLITSNLSTAVNGMQLRVEEPKLAMNIPESGHE